MGWGGAGTGCGQQKEAQVCDLQMRAAENGGGLGYGPSWGGSSPLMWSWG